MTKSDDFIKEHLRKKLDLRKFHSRVYLGTGSEKSDQELWINSGLTFSYERLIYGSNDFGIYKDHSNWYDPDNDKSVKEEPVVIIEGTDALNRGSSGDAQAQRLHHLYASAKLSIISIYYLHPGKHSLFGPMVGAMYYFSKLNQKEMNNSKAVILVTSKLDDIQNIVDNLDNDSKLKTVINGVLSKMKLYFDNFFNRKYKSNWDKFYEKNQAGITENGNYFYLSAIRAPHPKTKKPPWSDSHHRAASLPFMYKYLLLGDPRNRNKKFYFIVPLFTRDEISKMNKSKLSDKEWKIFTGKYHSWDIITPEEIITQNIEIFNRIDYLQKNNLNKNPFRSEKEIYFTSISDGLANGTMKIKIDKNKFNL
ncbi:MAG: hypothetical protein HeimC2_11090 [Candidatus Heimdallarchaeota archaeon LC_2]|nr:MAG: hypothetical protein HeimC2_11090 [Candidatus Heimdallarchaeota archaeon LC_2]